MDPAAALVTFFAENIHTSAFLAGIVGNLLASAGYDAGKAGLSSIKEKLDDVWRRDGRYRNHDLMRALLFAECEAAMHVCEVCLIEDYGVEPSFLRAAVQQGDITTFAKTPDARIVARLRREYGAWAASVQEMPADAIESVLASELADVSRTVSAGREWNAAEDASLRTNTTGRARCLLQALTRPDWLTAKTDQLREWFGGDPRERQAPAALVARFDADWFDLFRAGFREALKSDAFTAARRGFELDVLSHLENTVPRSLAQLEAKAADADRKLNRILTALAEPGVLARPLAPELPLAAPDLLVGRDRELKALCEALLAPPPRAILVTGAARIGKTALTATAFHDDRVVARFGTRRFFVRCEAAVSCEGLVQQIGRQLGLGSNSYDPVAVRDSLLQAPALLLLDNLETPYAADASNVEEFLSVLSALQGVVLAASLRGDGSPARIRWQRFDLKPLDLSAGRQIFAAIAPECQVPSDALLAHMDGVPLAIELLAYAGRQWNDLRLLEQRWQSERTKLLERGASRLESLHVSLNVSVSSPRVQSSPHAKRVFSVLAFLPDGLAVTDLNSVLGPGAIEGAQILCETGLARRDGGRVRMLNPVREFARSDHPPLKEDLDRAIDWFLDLGRQGDKVGTAKGRDVAIRLAADVGNVEAMMLEGMVRTNPMEAVEAAMAFGKFQRSSGLGTTVPLELARKTLHGLESPVLEANCILSLGTIAFERSQNGEARQHYEAARTLYKQVGAVLGEANCITCLGDIALRRSQHDEARSYFQTGLNLYSQIPEPFSMGWSELRLARLSVGREEKARHYKTAQDLWSSIDRPDLVAIIDSETG